jgi:hypothetical protein
MIWTNDDEIQEAWVIADARDDFLALAASEGWHLWRETYDGRRHACNVTLRRSPSWLRSRAMA